MKLKIMDEPKKFQFNNYKYVQRLTKFKFKFENIKAIQSKVNLSENSIYEQITRITLTVYQESTEIFLRKFIFQICIIFCGASQMY